MKIDIACTHYIHTSMKFSVFIKKIRIILTAVQAARKKKTLKTRKEECMLMSEKLEPHVMKKC